MRKLIGVIVLGIMLSTVGFAQQGPHQRQRGQRDASPEERVDRMVGRLTEQLDLTENQQAEIKVFHLAQMKEGKALMKEATREEHDELRESHRKLMDQKMETVLSAAQLEKYDQMKAKRKGKSGKKRGHRKGTEK